ncbi:MAG: response regulator [Anaerolineae bacterium]|nr:response regulator [Anaerolineae bacterium]
MSKALVIDDEAPLTALIGRFLESAGFSVESAACGVEGLQKAAATRPDLVVLDIMMPDMDGYEVCRRLRADPRTARAAIVALTARTQPIDKQMALRAGADMHLVKPFSGKALVETVQGLLAARALKTRPLGYQIAVLRLKQGVGATMLAANLALALTEEKGQMVTAVDLALSGGQIGGMLDLQAERSWIESWPGDEGVDGLVPHLLRHSSGLFALPAPALPPGMALPETWRVARLLQIVRGWSDYAVLDTPVALGNLAPILLESSSLVLLLLSPDESMRAVQATLAAIKKSAAETLKVLPVLNEAPAEQKPSRLTEIQTKERIEQVLGLPVAVVLPWSLGQQPVMVSRPESSLAVAIRALAQQVAGLATGSA